MSKKLADRVEDRPVDVTGPFYVARIPGVPMVFHGETKMQAMRKAKAFAQEHGPKARRQVRRPQKPEKESTADAPADE